MSDIDISRKSARDHKQQIFQINGPDYDLLQIRFNRSGSEIAVGFVF